MHNILIGLVWAVKKNGKFLLRSIRAIWSVKKNATNMSLTINVGLTRLLNTRMLQQKSLHTHQPPYEADSKYSTTSHQHHRHRHHINLLNSSIRCCSSIRKIVKLRSLSWASVSPRPNYKLHVDNMYSSYELTTAQWCRPVHISTGSTPSQLFCTTLRTSWKHQTLTRDARTVFTHKKDP